MIPVNELRKGNIVLLDTGLSPCSKHVIQAKDIYDIDRGLIAEQSIIIEPIPLTPEILECAGFDRVLIEINDWYLWSIGINPVTKDFLFSLKEHRNKIFFYRNAHHQIQYLHELQNLFFALTGQELTLPESLHP